jgi:predicted metalloprotease with PDZ domain
MFHLWIPNGVELSGNYDWFYEGFALYRSLKFGVEAKQIRFTDLLNSLAQAYNLENIQPNGISLVEASKARWSGANTRIYARGMVVAFLCDLALLQRSKGKVSNETLLREIFRQHHNSVAREDGNAAILRLFGRYPELDEIVRLYISGSEKVEWEKYLHLAGIESSSLGDRVNLKVTTRPGRRQKDLLKRLGYNG